MKILMTKMKKKMMMKSKIWGDLISLQQNLAKISLKALFENNNSRFENFSLEAGDLLLDFSKQRITNESLDKLIELLAQSNFFSERQALFSGTKKNLTENRLVLHTLLRDLSSHHLKNEVQAGLAQLKEFSEKLNIDSKKGIKTYTDIICLGIGGSFLGPSLLYQAFCSLNKPFYKLHFISNIDGNSIERLVENLDPSTTLCIITSKTFTTVETLRNAERIKKWYSSHLKNFNYLESLVGITANRQKAMSFGIPESNIFEFWEGIGGRYSIWSSVSLPIILSHGFNKFEEFLQGAFEMDKHFLNADLKQNMPVILALLGVWNNNFWNYGSHAILPYEDALATFPNYVQQLDMESNGKSVNLNNEILSYKTAPIIFGSLGCDAQHAFMQLLHQGNQVVPVDFLIPASSPLGNKEHHQLLVASCLSQSQALMEGLEESLEYKSCPGDRPSSTIMYSKFSPKILGQILALYEHKIFVQGMIWEINSFDQWGVELGKKIAKKILPQLENNPDHENNSVKDILNSSTRGLIKFFQKNQALS